MNCSIDFIDTLNNEALPQKSQIDSFDKYLKIESAVSCSPDIHTQNVLC